MAVAECGSGSIELYPGTGPKGIHVQAEIIRLHPLIGGVKVRPFLGENQGDFPQSAGQPIAYRDYRLDPEPLPAGSRRNGVNTRPRGKDHLIQVVREQLVSDFGKRVEQRSSAESKARDQVEGLVIDGLVPDLRML